MTRHALTAGFAALLLAACGGGGGGGGGGDAGPTSTAAGTTAAAAGTATVTSAATSVVDGVSAPSSSPTAVPPAQPPIRPPERPPTRDAAARFLTQASFGPTDAAIDRVVALGYAGWIDEQFTLPATSNRARWEAADAAIKLITPTASAGQDQVWEAFWYQAANSPDQLRLRVAFALSQIFVISAVDSSVGNEPRALAAWLDMLGDQGFTTYRSLLESAALHPLMGMYLSYIKNQKADPVTGRHPDQNFARESMQLFSVGLVQLNSDGTPLLVGGKTVDTFGGNDVAGLANVYTGFSWACPAAPNASCFSNGSSGGVSDPDHAFKPMVAYPQYHSTEVKTFLGVTIPAQTTATAASTLADLKIALDTLANHANTAPFISRQLIQRLVTSNPSPAYVQSVAATFNNNGAGVRGDLKAVVKAILTHPESRLQSNVQGKLREPVLRLSAYLRAYPHKSDTGNWKVGNTDSVAGSLGQTPLRSPSVFNFYRPAYVPPDTQAAAAGLVAPEMQLLNESSAAGWVNYMRDNLTSGVGQYNGTIGTVVYNRRDLQRDWSTEMALAAQPADLVAQVTGKLLYGLATDALRTDISTTIGKIIIPVLNSGGTNQAAIDAAKLNRVKATLLLTLASPEFLVQK